MDSVIEGIASFSWNYPQYIGSASLAGAWRDPVGA